MSADPLENVRATLRRLGELGLTRPASSSVRDWLRALASVGLLEAATAREIADGYDAVRFGGSEVDAARWQPLESALRDAVTRFEALSPDRRDAIVAELCPVVAPPEPEPKPAPPAAAERPSPSAKPRWALALAAVGLIAAGVYLWKRDTRRPPPRPRPATQIVDLSVAAATSSASMFHRRVDLPGGAGRAISLVDYDADGDLDVFVASDRLRLFENRGSRLIDVSREIGIAGGARSGQWADFDGDGDLDLATTATRRQPMLFLRDGAEFIRRPLPVHRPFNPEGHGWLDYDSDGDSDLVVTNGALGLSLFNNTSGALIDVSVESGFGPEGWGQDNGDFIHFLDFDGDERVDLLYAATTGLAARNVDGKRFEAATVAFDFAMIDGSQKQAMALADIDGDRDLDAFAPQVSSAALIENKDGALTPIESEAVRLLGGRVRTALFGDVDQDGELELVVAVRGGGLELFDVRETGLENATPGSGLSELTARIEILGMALGDIDGDGDLDLVYQALRGAGGILLNRAELPAGRARLLVSFETPPVSGTQIAVRSKSERWQTRVIGRPTNSGSQQPFRQIFSVAEGSVELDIRLTDGRGSCTTAVVNDGARSLVIDKASIAAATDGGSCAD